MIRKFNAVAVAALALVAAAGAQAQTSVSVYGTIDQAFVSMRDAADAYAGSPVQRLRGIEDGGMTASFLGFAGTEDLGNGLKAKFKLESYLKADTGTTTSGQFWSRNSWLGLSGGFGTVLAGQTETPLWDTTLAFNPFGSSLFSPAQRQYFGNTYGAVAPVGQNNAWSNSVTYYTPGELGGFTGALQYAFKEQAAGSGSFGGSVGYAAGPVAVAGVFQQVKTGYAAGHQNTWQLDGSYDLGVVKAFAQYGQVKDTATPESKVKIWQLGASMPLGSGAALVSYGERKGDDSTSYRNSNKTFALGYDYNLSKRTDVYAAYAYDRFSENVPGAKYDNTNSVGVGIRHRF